MATAYKHGFGALGAAYTGYRYARPYLYYGSAIAAGIGAAKLRSWYKRKNNRPARGATGLSGYRPPEQKECLVQDVAFPVTRPSATTTSIINLVRIQQGTSKYERIGNKVTATSLQLNATLKNPSTVAIKTRLMLVYDKEWNQFSNVPANYTLWLHSLLDAPSFGENYVHAMRNTDYMSRFTVVKDWTFTLAPLPEPGSEKNIKHFQKLGKKYYTKFVNNGSDTFSVSQGQLCLVAFSERVSSTENVQLNYMMKLKFTDN